MRRTFPPVSRERIGEWYPVEYYGDRNRRFLPALEGATRWFRDRRAQLVSRQVERGPILDVGCGRGHFLARLRELGYEPHGTELSPEAAQHARQELGIPVGIGGLSDTSYPEHHFNAIFFIHSLEHLPSPRTELATAGRLLRPGGLLIIAVPNSESWQARAGGKHWFHLDVPRHYYHFSLSTLCTLLEKLEFQVVRSMHFNLEQNPYGWLQTLYNRLGFRHNLLYACLRNRSARRGHPIRENPLQTAAVLSSLPLATPLAFALSLAESLMKAGGTVEVVARK